MKKTKQIITLITVFSFLLNTMPLSVYAKNSVPDIETSEQEEIEVIEEDIVIAPEYNPEVFASGSSENDTYYTDSCTLSAPEGFLISIDKDNFYSSVNISLDETVGDLANTVEYFLKNNTEDSEYYNAVSGAMTYNYYCVINTPEIKNIETYRKIDTSMPLRIVPHIGLVSNQTIVVKIKAKGTYKDISDFNIYSADDHILAASVNGRAFIEDDENYFEAEYEISLKDEELYKDVSLDITAVNDAGESAFLSVVSGAEAVNHLVIDSVPPSVVDKDIVIRYVNDKDVGGGFFVADGIVSDEHTGIAKIEYKWDRADRYNEYDNNSVKEYVDEKHHSHKYFEGAQSKSMIERSMVAKEMNFSSEFYKENTDEKHVHFRILVPYENSYKTSNDRHTLYLRVTDYAGNISETSGEFISNRSGGIDTLTPVINKLDIASAEKDGKINILPSGNYSNKSIIITVSGEDKSDSENYISGIREFSITNDENDAISAAVDDESLEYMLNMDNEYVSTNSKITSTDKGNYTYSNSISAEIKRLFDDENIIDKPSDYLKDIKSDTFIVENKSPKAKFDISKRVAQYLDEDGNDIYWFNSKKDNIDFSFKDNLSGINNITVNRNSLNINKFDFSQESSRKMSYDFKDDISSLETGTYAYSIKAEDNSGNKTEQSFTINIDNEKPNGEISISSQNKEVVKIDKEYWVDKDDEFVFKITGTDNYSGVKDISVTVNGQNFDFKNTNHYDYIDAGEDIQILTISKSQLEAQNIRMNSDHTYNVICNVTDFAENKSEEKKFTVHVDMSDPVIEKAEIKSINAPNVWQMADNSISLLPFGIFANTSLTFRVKVSDELFDSGISEFNVAFEEENYITLYENDIIYEGDSKFFEFEIPFSNGEIFEKYINMSVYDKYGKYNTRFEKISSSNQDDEIFTPAINEDDRDSVNVVLEDKAPDMMIDVPEPDYVDKDGKIWFNKERRSIVLNVQDSESGLNNVSVSVNDKKLYKDCEEHVFITPEDVNSVLKNKYEYTFYTDAPDSENEYAEKNGEYILRFSSSDNAGNVNEKPMLSDSSLIDQYTYYVDDTAPDINSVSFAPVSVNGVESTDVLYEEPEIFNIDDLNYGLFFKTDYDLLVYPSDGEYSSGLRNVNYKLISYADSSQPSLVSEGSEKVNEQGYAVIHISKGFKGRIVISADDNVGNLSDEKYADAFVSEDKAPELSIDISNETKFEDKEGNPLFSEDVMVTVTVTDTTSGIKNCKIDIDSENKNELVSSYLFDASDYSEDEWTVVETDANLITKISRTFVFSKDDNNIVLRATATDNCGNEIEEPVESKKFTIDKTAPVINVSCSESYNGSNYYNKDKPAVITLDITERNFDADLIKTRIENGLNGGSVPSISFEDIDVNTHRAVITFAEGDYIFSVSGSDMAGQKAIVNAPFEGSKVFYVDETAPVMSTNFSEFSGSGEFGDFFNQNKKVVVNIKEHNFDASLANISVMKKASGSSHDSNGMSDDVYSFVKYSDWKTDANDKDLHTLEFEIDRDSVYKLVISPVDRAGNSAGSDESAIFEIDTEKPSVVMKNDTKVSGTKNEIEFLDIYTSDRSGEPLPSIEFDDTNFHHLSYTLIKYVPDVKSSRELESINYEIVKKEDLEEKKFVLNDFSDDGVYALEIKAVDKAGNESVLNKNTYVKMIDKDVLAYIPDSSIEKSSGLFSLEYENGNAISKRPDSFEDIDIVVMARSESDVRILLRDLNGDEKNTMLIPETPENKDKDMYGMGVYRYKLKKEFFAEHYQSDTDTELYLTVKNGDDRIDLARIHIDNIAPSGDTDSKFKSWHWYPGSESQNIVISNISEFLNEENCKVYDKGEEIPFTYSEETNTLSFMLGKGWHDIGVHLEDYAGNKFDIQQVDNINVGFFWLWVILGGVAVSGGGVAAYLILRKKFKNK